MGLPDGVSEVHTLPGFHRKSVQLQDRVSLTESSPILIQIPIQGSDDPVRYKSRRIKTDPGLNQSLRVCSSTLTDLGCRPAPGPEPLKSSIRVSDPMHLAQERRSNRHDSLKVV
ncbi:hypothetical protein EYF80_033990 [Liparis tanakae]|uniref:Uncharacterized protein n=1 Tax=Liparis tanakae TaxID=230148 RepID=A0A4Z2GQ61_9TELE|nr:hypothetical protein EYF80_033990 [Liparis tanakae]